MGSGVSTTLEVVDSAEEDVIGFFEEMEGTIDQDGKLTRAELKAHLSQRCQSLGAEWSDELIDKAFDLFDMNKDGKFNQYEFLAVVNAIEEKAPPKVAPTRRLFDLIDQNGDKNITPKEADEIASALGINEDHLWMTLCGDDKNDKKIDFKEFNLAVKGLLIGLLSGKRAAKGKKSLQADIDPVLEEAIKKLEEKGWKPHGKKKGAKKIEEQPPPTTQLTFKKMTDEEMDALMKLHAEQQAKAKQAAQEAEEMRLALAQAQKEKEEADAAAEKARLAALREAEREAAEDAKESQPTTYKDADGNWCEETPEQTAARYQKFKDERAAAKAAANRVLTDRETKILEATGGDAVQREAIEARIAAAQQAVEDKKKQKAADKAAEAEAKLQAEKDSLAKAEETKRRASEAAARYIEEQKAARV